MMSRARRALRCFTACLAWAAVLTPGWAWADVQTDRFTAGGYYRIMTEPDFQGGSGRLGYSTLYGRLLNEGPYGILELKLAMLQSAPTENEVWANVNARIEGGSVQNADTGLGNLNNYRVSQLFVEAGNLMLKKVTWRVGTLWYYPGDLGLYDLRPAQLFYDTVGVSGFYHGDIFDLMVGLGDAGYGIRGTAYDTIFTGGAWLRARLGPHAEIGVGGQGYYEPGIPGNPNAPYQTPGIAYEDYYRQQVVQQFLLAHPGEQNLFPSPIPTNTQAGYGVGYLGFGKLGPIVWDNLYGNYGKQYPQNSYVENYQGQPYSIYIHDFTDHAYYATVGNEMQIRVIPNWLDAAWGVLWGWNRNYSDTIAAGTDNETYMSTVLRLQLYITETVHFLLENSLAEEHSLQGNLWREHVDSVFQNTHGVANTYGLEYGDTDHRYTWQGKTGFVFNPGGKGIYNRPSLRLLYGLQYSNVQDSFGSNFNTSLAQYNQFPGVEHHWHSVVAAEVEGWF